MKHYGILASVFLAMIFLFAFSEDQVPNLTQPRPAVFTCGQPTEAGFQQLAAMGIRTVINVLPEPQCLKGEQNMVQMNHMVYQRLPFESATLTRDTVDDFGYLMLTAEQPVLIHCSTGNHVGGLWLAYRVTVEHAPVSVALREARKIGIQPSMESLVLHWLGEQANTVKTSGK